MQEASESEAKKENVPAIPQCLSEGHDKEAHPERAEPPTDSSPCDCLKHSLEDNRDSLHHEVDAATPPQVDIQRLGGRGKGRDGGGETCRERLRRSVRVGRVTISRLI